jgi:hypothetical protein
MDETSIHPNLFRGNTRQLGDLLLFRTFCWQEKLRKVFGTLEDAFGSIGGGKKEKIEAN